MSIQERLRRDLVLALREGDKTEISMVRTLIAALENAEAVEADDSVDISVAFHPDQPRRVLTEDDVHRILESERAEVADAAEHYRVLGIDDEAEDLELRTRIVDRYLATFP